jgi:RNase P/RNase MRP subunit p30
MDIDIITYHPTETKELLRFTRKHYRQATDRGIFFEIPYSHMLRDSSNRKKIIQISHLYHTVGKSRVRFIYFKFRIIKFYYLCFGAF